MKQGLLSLLSMKLSQGFAPVALADARILILGSMPGSASLQATRYYAFTRNAFWKIMGDLYSAGPELDYSLRLQKLVENKIALWDVIASCHRPGSLDSDISRKGLETNNFKDFFAEHPHISHICFNGQKAATLFKTLVLANLDNSFKTITLPSTSPAHAAKNYAAKLAAWSVIKTL